MYVTEVHIYMYMYIRPVVYLQSCQVLEERGIKVILS